MAPLHESPGHEATGLRRCLNDIVGIAALPALWSGAAPERIAGTLLDALGELLGASFVYARLDGFEGAPRTEVSWVGEPPWGDATAHEIGASIEQALGPVPSRWPADARVHLRGTDFRLGSACLGVQGEVGLIVAGCRRESFPELTERVLLDVAASQAAVALQHARLREQQEQLARSLDDRVAERTRELAAACEELRSAAAERERAQADRDMAANNLTRFLDTFPGYVVTLSPDGRVEHLNQEVLAYFGKTPEELRDWSLTDAVPPDELPWVVETVGRSFAAGEPYTIEHRCRRADGVYRWFEIRSHPVRDGGGRLTGWYVLLTDIDRRKRVENALREREREARLIVDSIPGMIAVFSPAGAVEFVNQTTLDFYGNPLEEHQRWETSDQVHPDDLPYAVEAFLRAVAAGEPFEMEVRARRADGAYRWVHSRGSPLRDSDGQVVRWFNLLTDIDERKRAEQSLAASEQNLKLTIDTIPAMAWSTGPGGGADFFNQHYLDYIGLSSEQLAGWGWTAALHPDDLNGLATAWQERLASGEPLEAEARLRRHDGAYRWFLVRASPLRDGSGCIAKWYGVNADIEDRKQSEDALRRSEAFLLDIQRLSRFGTWRFNVATGVLEHSAETHRAYGVQPGDDVASAAFWFGRIHPDDRSRVQAEFERCAREGEPYQAAYRIVLPDGRVGYSHSSGHPIVNDAGETEFYGAVIDMTAEWETANELERASEALRELQAKMSQAAQVATMGEFAASVAHEVNQPLAGIITNASTCLRMLGADPPAVQGAGETVRRILRDGNRAAEVITRLRALFSKKELAMEPLDLNAAIREVVALSTADLQKHQVSLQLELADDLPSFVGDRVQLQQVVVNLIRNAADALSGVTDRPRLLSIRTGLGDDDRVWTSVRDNGFGVDPAVGNDLFEPFYTTKRRGMGIGLSVSRSIIESHRGRIWVERNEGPGSTFVFTLPAGPD